MHSSREGGAATRLAHAYAGVRLRIALLDIQRLLDGKYDPNQPRVPAGEPGGGQWTSGDGESDSGLTRVAQGDHLQGYLIDLREEEAHGGHTIRAHVGKSTSHLLRQVRREQTEVTRGRRFAEGLAVGSFTSLEAATRLTNSTLAQNRALVDQVARGTLLATRIEALFESPTGYEAYARTERAEPYIRETFGVGVVIRHVSSAERGFRIVSAFPINLRR